MNQLWRVLVAIALTVFFAMLWLITQPLIINISNTSESITQTLAVNTTGSAQTYTLIRLGANIGFALCALMVWLWCFASVQTEDFRGEYA